MPIAGEIDEFLSFEAIGRHLDVGTWRLSMASDTEQAKLIEPGRGIVLYVEGQQRPVFTGPIDTIQKVKSKDEPGTLTVTGFCDNIWFGERYLRRNPAQTFSRETEGEWDGHVQVSPGVSIAPTNSAMWIWHAVLQNFRIPYVDTFNDLTRRIPFMDLPNTAPTEVTSLPNDDMWKSFSIKAHMKPIDELAFELARRAGLTARFYWDPETEKIKLTVLPAEDKSQTVVFDEQAGNLVGQTIVSEAPKATRVIQVGAAPTEDNPRRYYQYRKNVLHNPPGWVSRPPGTGTDDPTSWSDPYWGREFIETYWNRTTEGYSDVRDSDYHPTPDASLVMPDPPPGSEEAQRFDTAQQVYFVENGIRGQVSLDVIDIEDCTFGTHYHVGDIVRCLIDTSLLPPDMVDEDGVLRQQIQEVHISSSANELWKIKPLIGGEESSSTPYVYRELRRLRRLVEETNERV